MDPRRAVPSTDTTLADPRLATALVVLGRERVRDSVREVQDLVRTGAVTVEAIVPRVVSQLSVSGLRPVINATGAVLHTNLGRAPLSDSAMLAVTAAARHVDVEYDLTTGTRAPRGRSALAALRRALPDAGDVLVVNNGAAALMLSVTALAAGQEVLWSRGELVEIGDGFRLTDLVASAGVGIREVGTTNRTTRADYVIGPDTACILKVHPSNFVISGFTSAPSVAELAGLGPPLVVDVGSGLLDPDPLLPDEPSVSHALRAGAGLVTCSGDKLLGGPQCGIVAGTSELVSRVRRHPLARAVRVDKLTLAALEATLDGSTPTRVALHADPDDLRRRATRIAEQTGGEVVPSAGVVGGGAAPGLELPGWAVALSASLHAPLRLGEPPIVGRVHQGRLLLDLRAVPPDADDVLVRAIQAARV
jgi:L-seryl-tRNA(Ser) seleniumtransferase